MDSLTNEIINENVPYFIASNQIVQDKRLSLKARGLACYMRSLPNNWKFSYRGLMATTGEGQTAILNALKELIEAGYLERIDGRDEKGYKTSKYILHMSPCVENPSVENPSVENQRTYKINNNKLNNNKESDTHTKKPKGFVPPTVDEVREYCRSEGYTVDAETFVAFYASNHWRDSRDKPVKNWKQRVISWAGGRNKKVEKQPTGFTPKVQLSDNASAEDTTFFDEFLK